MKRFILPKFIFYPVAVIIMLAAVAGVWMTWQAQQENYNLGLAVNQILRVVSRAREMKLAPNADAAGAQNALINYLVTQDSQPSVVISDGGGARKPVLALVNPWTAALKIFLYPTARAVRLETSVSSNNCKRILGYYAPDAVSLGLQRVDVIGNAKYELWGLVYDVKKEKEPEKGLDLEKIRINCGVNSQTVISLTFSLP